MIGCTIQDRIFNTIDSNELLLNPNYRNNFKRLAE
jgi:hypothetical protein